MKKLVTVATAIAAFGFVNAASAADLPTKAPALVAAPVFNWTGLYAGVNAGGGWGHSDSSTNVTGTGYFAASSLTAIAGAGPSLNPNGFIGGAQLGYNWQTGAMVLGLETDFEYFHMNGSGSSTTVYPCCAPTSFTLNTSVTTDWLWTLRPRIGWATNNLLLYVTGGLAVTQVKANWTFTDTFAAATESGSASQTKAGWTIGGGAEMAAWGRWTVKAEYLYADFGSVSATSNNLVVGVPVPTRTFSHSVNLRTNIARVGLNYRF